MKKESAPALKRERPVRQRVTHFFFNRHRPQAKLAQRDLEKPSERSDRIDAGLGTKVHDKRWPRVGVAFHR
jgi:hypothetical protein